MTHIMDIAGRAGPPRWALWNLTQRVMIVRRVGSLTSWAMSRRCYWDTSGYVSSYCVLLKALDNLRSSMYGTQHKRRKH